MGGWVVEEAVTREMDGTRTAIEKAAVRLIPTQQPRILQYYRVVPAKIATMI